MSPARRRIAFVFAALALAVGAAFFIARHRSAPRGVTVDSVKNIACPVGLGDTVEWVPLQDGKWEEPVTWEERREAIKSWWAGDLANPWDCRASRERVEMDSSALGTFAGRPAAAVVFWESGGGSGVYYSVGLVLEEEGKPVCVASAGLGDRTRILGAKIVADRIVLDLVCSGPDDPACCPTQHECRTYGWMGKRLELDLLSTEPLPALPEYLKGAQDMEETEN